MTQALERPRDTVLQPQYPSVPKGHIGVMTDDGLKISAYAIGQWVKYDIYTGRICGICWEDKAPKTTYPYDHWTGEWEEAGFMYQVRALDEENSDWSDISEENITSVLGEEQARDMEKIRMYRLNQKLLINIVCRTLKDHGGILPQHNLYQTQRSVCWDEPAFKVGTHIQWQSKPGSITSAAVGGTALIIGIERCTDEEPGFWSYKLQRLTGYRFDPNTQFGEEEILEALPALNTTAVNKLFEWGNGTGVSNSVCSCKH